MSKKLEEVNQVNNYFIDKYLKYLKRKFENNERSHLKDYIIISIYLFNVIKNIIFLFKEFDYETRIFLCDVSLFIGGNTTNSYSFWST
jgi:hypothetical protein